MAGKNKGAMRGARNMQRKLICCLAILVAAVALFGASTTFAVADNEGKIQNVRLAWDASTSDPEQGTTISGDNIALEPQGPGVNAAGTTATAKLSFSVANADTDRDIEPGELTFTLPAHIFFDRDGNLVGTFKVGLGEGEEELGNNTFYYTYDRDNDQIVITNGKAIHDSGNYSLTLAWSATNAAGDDHAKLGADSDASGARNIASGSKRDDIQATSVLTQGGVEERDSSNSLSYGYTTSSDFSLEKNAVDYQFDWNDDWGTNPDPEGGYVYTIWEAVVTQTGKGTQPYTLSVEDLPQSPEGGEVVYNSLDPNASSKKDVSWMVAATSTDEATPKTITYVVRYPVPEDGKGFKASNKTEATMVPRDYVSSTKEDDAEMQIYSLDFKYPGTGPGIEKTSYETHREGAINAINDAAVGGTPAEIQGFRYNIAGSMRGGALTLAEGVDPHMATIDDYGKRAYSVELTDDLLMLGNEQLTDDDYEITQITVGDRDETVYEKSAATGGKYASRKLSVDEWCQPDADGNNPTADVYIRYANTSEYVKYGTVTYVYNGKNLLDSTFTPASGMEDAFATATAGTNGKAWYGAVRLPLDLPAGVNGAQIRWSSKNYATRIASTVLLNLKATQHVKDIVADQPKLVLTNVNSLRTFDPDGNWYEPSTSSGAEGEGLADIVSRRDEGMYTGDDAGKYAYHATAGDTLESFSGHTSIVKGGRSGSGDAADNSATTNVQFNYSAKDGGYTGLYYVDMADWSALSKVYNGRMESAVRNQGYVNEQNEGTFYDLLPAGMTVDTSTVAVWEKQLESDDSANEGWPAVGKCSQSYAAHEANGDKLSSGYSYESARCDSSVKLVQNWRGSGRTMMIVHVQTKDGKNLYNQRFGISNTDEHYYWYSGFHMEFKAFYSDEAFTDYGGSFTNSVAYMGQSSQGENASKLWDGYADDASAPSLTDAKWLGDLDDDGNENAPSNVVYAQESTGLHQEGAAEATPNKRVRDDNDPDTSWKTDTVTTQGGSYTYRLRTIAAEDMGDVVVYDDIERHVVTDSISADNPQRWYGTFAGVYADPVQIERLGIEPVVYYATNENLNLYTNDTTAANDGTDRDLANTNVWTRADDYTGDLADVTAVAVDLGHDAEGNAATIPAGQSINVYIQMNAPTDPVACKTYHDGNYRAVNRWILSSTTGGTHRLLPIRPVTVRINATVADFTFTKVDSGGHALSGAEFALLRWDGDGDAPNPSDGVVDAENPGDGWTKVGSLTSGDDGTINFENLVAGTYRLVETKAPSGYERPTGQWQVTVDPTADAGSQVAIQEVDDGASKPVAFAIDADTHALSLPNYRPFELPVSGGWGLVGVVVAALALAGLGLVLELRRRAHR